MFENPTGVQRRCLAYMDERAEAEGFTYDLSVTHFNEQPLIRLWDACLKFDAGDLLYTPEIMQAYCDAVLDASRHYVLQGCSHREPEDMSVYQKLFNTATEGLFMSDVPYTPPKAISLRIQWSLDSDDQAVLKLTPGAQLGLPWDELKEVRSSDSGEPKEYGTDRTNDQAVQAGR